MDSTHSELKMKLYVFKQKRDIEMIGLGRLITFKLAQGKAGE